MERDVLLQATLTRLTATIENVDPFDDPPEPSRPNNPAPDEVTLLLTTATKASGENEEDEDDADRSFIAAMVTTLTESSGDQENDPDERAPRDDHHYGDKSPLAYRFAEFPVIRTASVDYDHHLQMHVIDGRAVMEIINNT